MPNPKICDTVDDYIEDEEAVTLRNCFKPYHSEFKEPEDQENAIAESAISQNFIRCDH